MIKVLFPSRRKMLDLLILVVLATVFYFLFPVLEGVILFVFGYIWNWCASIELDPVYENRRFRFSMLSTVRNFQKLILKPFRRAPRIIQKLISILPAGIFWAMVVYINDSVMPWWAPFVGSAAYELLQIELNFIKNRKEQL